MGSIKSIVMMLLSIMIFTSELDVYATNSFASIESKIDSTSNATKIKKMQSALKDFNIYTGSIDGDYSSSLYSLLTYQKNTGIIKDDTDFGAGYFGEKTLTALSKDFPEIFDGIVKKHLQIDEFVDIKAPVKIEEPVTMVRYFYVTAYYSPVPGQKRYISGSFEGDVKLNGEGKHTASGKEVFSGLLAAPSNYAFGTKIELEGIGVGEVSDRGGSIVKSGQNGYEYDRIDVWMGFGDEGLQRAISWGKRKITGKVVPNTRELSMEFDSSPVVKYGNLIVDAEKPIQPDVIKLQNLLTEVKIYTGAIDGNFDNIKEVLIKYQVENNIISSKNDPQAGFFGVKTLGVLREKSGGNIFKVKNNQLDEEIILSPEVKGKMDILNSKITNLIDSKYGKNTPKAIAYRGKLRNIIELQTKKDNNDLRKKQLKYLKSIL